MMQSAKPLLIIGTRGSPLALWQAERVRECLCAAHGLAESDVSIEVIKTTGDMIQDRPLTEIGGKGLFTKEIEQALFDRRIDIAVHSAKDMLAFLPDGLTIAAYLEREDPRDALIGQSTTTLMALPPGSIIGTASPRRHAQVLRLRPDLTIVPLRGNVETRLRKLKAGECHATLLAIAGLKRLGRAEVATEILDADRFLPAVAQGAIAIEARQNDDDRMHALLARINHAPTRIAVDAERAFLSVLEGNCKTPIAGYAQTQGGAISFRGMILRPDGRETFETSRKGRNDDATRLGADAARELKSLAPSDFFAA